MNIVVLDGYTLNPGDLSWETLESLGACSIYDRSPPEQVVPRATSADIILVNKVSINEACIKQLPKLRYIGVLATGYNNITIENPRITVTNVPAYSTASVAQHTFACILALTQHISEHSNSVHQSHWVSNPDFSYWETPLIELEGLTLGIIGYGAIGRAVAKIAQAFGMRILVYTRSPQKLDHHARSVSKEELLQTSDIITLHCPKTPETTNLISQQELKLMKPSAFLINVSRGGIVNEQDLANALNQNLIAGAAVDVLSKEPPDADNPLLQTKNCIITPHIAWATKASRQRLLNIAVDNIKAYLSGKPQNVVFPVPGS